jgi:ribonuclease Z
VSVRELVVLGTASQAPTRHRNHNGYLLRWDGAGLLFDPGEGTQRQMLFAGVPSSAITRICLTPEGIEHSHGDHCLGVPGVIQRLSLDRVAHPVDAHYPASGRHFFARLRHASAFQEVTDLREVPIARDGPVAQDADGTLEVRRLDHPVESFGYRLVEPDGRRMRPDLLAAAGIAGPEVGRLHRETFLDADAGLAKEYGHLTARQAASVARDCGVRRLVLTHFSQRYPDPDAFAQEAAAVFDGDLVVAADLTRVPVPPRRAAS